MNDKLSELQALNSQALQKQMQETEHMKQHMAAKIREIEKTHIKITEHEDIVNK